MSWTTVAVQVPATTANLGPGFDCLGAAWTLHNSFRFTPLAEAGALEILATGPEAEKVGTDADNLAYRAFAALFNQLRQPIPGVRIDIGLSVPLARGLGSSATAIVGGLVGANWLAGAVLSPQDLADLATNLEGHPDNVVPALQGGCRLAATTRQGSWEIADLDWHPSVIPVIAILYFELSTEAARRVLLDQYSRIDAIFTATYLGLLVRALATGKAEWLQAALQDRLHQPYRQALIPGYERVEAAALANGALGLVISGAGPALLAIARPETAPAVAEAMRQAWQSQGISTTTQVLELDRQGAQATPL
jgi:homoserine kinase